MNLIGKEEFSLIFFISMTRTEISDAIKEVKLMASPPPTNEMPCQLVRRITRLDALTGFKVSWFPVAKAR